MTTPDIGTYNKEELFLNCTYFIFPMKISDPERLNSYLASSGGWVRVDEPFNTQYILRYSSDMNKSRDGRLTSYRYAEAKKIPLYMFGSRIESRVEKHSLEESGHTPSLDDVVLYVFGSGIAFLEFRILYGDMTPDEIVEFVYLFRSLRFNESKDWLGFTDGSIGVGNAIEKLMPHKESGTELCFSNPSEVKRQALIFSAVCIEGVMNGATEKELDRLRYYLSHGYNNDFPFDGDGSEHFGKYEMCFNTGGGLYWGGAQDGLACVTAAPPKYQYERICSDYHFLYLLLLNQRFSAISYIEDLACPEIDLKRTKSVMKKVVDLKIRYSFRVISDDSNFQTIYGGMYEVLEIDNLLADLEDSNDRLSEILQEEHKANERRFGLLLGGLSILAIFSALIDLSDFADKIFKNTVGNWVSIGVNAVIIIVALLLVFRKGKD